MGLADGPQGLSSRPPSRSLAGLSGALGEQDGRRPDDPSCIRVATRRFIPCRSDDQTSDPCDGPHVRYCACMARYGTQFGPDITFLGVPRADLDEPAHVGGCRRGDPRCALRRGHLLPLGCAVRAQGDARDVLPGPRRLAAVTGDARGRPGGPRRRGRRRRGDVLRGCRAVVRRPRGGGHDGGRRRRDPAHPRGGPHGHLAGRHRGGPWRRPLGPGRGDPLRRARRHRRHRVRVAHRPRPADAPADRVRGGLAATGSCRSACAATGRRPRSWTGWPSSGCAATR